jgi:hypothetical protein
MENSGNNCFWCEVDLDEVNGVHEEWCLYYGHFYSPEFLNGPVPEAKIIKIDNISIGIGSETKIVHSRSCSCHWCRVPEDRKWLREKLKEIHAFKQRQ